MVKIAYDASKAGTERRVLRTIWVEGQNRTCGHSALGFAHQKQRGAKQSRFSYTKNIKSKNVILQFFQKCKSDAAWFVNFTNASDV